MFSGFNASLASILQTARQPCRSPSIKGSTRSKPPRDKVSISRWVVAKSKQSSCAEAEPFNLKSISRAVFWITAFAWSEAAAASSGRLDGTDAEALSNGKQLAAHGKNSCLTA